MSTYNDTLQMYFDTVAKKMKEVQILKNYTLQLGKQSITLTDQLKRVEHDF